MRSISVSVSLYKIIFLGLLSFLFLLLARQSFASTTAALLPVSDGNYTQWNPKSGSSHFAMVDETICNDLTDFNRESTVGQRDSYDLDISSIPNGATITQIDITPCASKNTSGGTNTTFDVFYRLDGVNSADAGAYALTTTTPAVLSTTSYSGLSIAKSGTTALEVGGVFTAGNRGLKVSQVSTVITYSIRPTVTTNSASSITQTTASLAATINPNGLSTTANYRYGTSNIACSSLPNVTSNTNIGSGTTGVSNPQGVATLSANTTYYFCATATNSDGTTYGSVLSFTTLPLLPTVTTDGAVSITTNSATLQSTINAHGVTSGFQFRYGTSNVACSSLPNATSVTNLSVSTDSAYQASPSGLSSGTTYYFCITGTNAAGTAYGSVLNFLTL